MQVSETFSIGLCGSADYTLSLAKNSGKHHLQEWRVSASLFTVLACFKACAATICEAISNHFYLVAFYCVFLTLEEKKKTE